MVRDKPLHNFLFETDPDGFYEGLDCYSTPWIDACVLLHLARRRRPRRFLEIGTNRGHTTRILAGKFPEMEIVTVDPGDQVPPGERPPNQATEYLPQHQIGELARDCANVRVVKRRVGEVDWRDARFEMIFIDGNHAYGDVLRDSHLALRLVTSPGVIVWHDFNTVRDVNLALDELELSPGIVWIHNTRMAYYDSH